MDKMDPQSSWRNGLRDAAPAEHSLRSFGSCDTVLCPAISGMCVILNSSPPPGLI